MLYHYSPSHVRSCHRLGLPVDVDANSRVAQWCDTERCIPCNRYCEQKATAEVLRAKAMEAEKEQAMQDEMKRDRDRREYFAREKEVLLTRVV